MKRIANYLDNEGRIHTWPAKQDAKRELLKHLSLKFENGTFYTEKDVNGIIEQAHTFRDYFLLRRELIESKLLCRTRDGRKYWKGDICNEKAGTERLWIEDAKESAASQLKDVYMSCSYLGEWTGSVHTPEYIDGLITGHPLPPKGSIEFHKTKGICRKETNETIGLLAYYQGYPVQDCIWIGFLLLRKEAQQQGYGREIVQFLLESAAQAGFTKAGIGVHLKNWPALRFWTAQGFDRITGIHGDKVCSSDTFSVAGLEKSLANREGSFL